MERSEPIRTRSETKLVFVRMFAFIYLATVPTPLLPSSDRGNNPLRINRLRPWPTPDLASVHALVKGDEISVAVMKLDQFSFMKYISNSMAHRSSLVGYYENLDPLYRRKIIS